jgi:release factor glutamine methyltransferase
VPADLDPAYTALLDRRLQREPASQIVGVKEFWGLEFEVSRDVLTPRPETELVVEAALDVVRGSSSGSRLPETANPVIVDIGTGSGAIAIALATELPDAHIIASDISLAALTVARRNARRHGVESRIAFLHSGIIPPGNDVDIIVSNPPYIRAAAAVSLPPEVRDYEPGVALFGGEDGLDFYRALLEHPQDLTDGGFLIVEVSYDQASAVGELAAAGLWGDADRYSWEPRRTYHDLQGIERVLTFQVRHIPTTSTTTSHE